MESRGEGLDVRKASSTELELKVAFEEIAWLVSPNIQKRFDSFVRNGTALREKKTMGRSGRRRVEVCRSTREPICQTGEARGASPSRNLGRVKLGR